MPKPSQNLPQIRVALTFYRVMSWATGIFLLLLVIEMVLKYSPTHVELFAFGSEGLLTFARAIPGPGCEPYSLWVPGGMGCEIESTGDGINLSLGILIAHGWMYVAYLLSCFRLFILMRWPLKRLVVMALGGVVPFLSFIVERRMHQIAVAEISEMEGRAALKEGAR